MEIGRGFKFRSVYSKIEYEIIRPTRNSWILKRLDSGTESGMHKTGLKEGLESGRFEDMSIKYNRIKLKFKR